MAEDQLMYYKVIDIGREGGVYLYRTRFEPSARTGKIGDVIVEICHGGKWYTTSEDKTILDQVKDRGSCLKMIWQSKYIKIDEEECLWLTIN